MADLISQAITAHFGERCKDFDPECMTCAAWREFDERSPSPVQHVVGGEPTPSRPEASSTMTGALPLSYGSPTGDLADSAATSNQVVVTDEQREAWMDGDTTGAYVGSEAKTRLALKTAPAEQVLGPDQKEIVLLNILAAMGGRTDSGDYPWSWLNWFCNDETERGGTDTFNRCEAKGWINTTHDSDSDHSTTTLTASGRAIVLAATASDAPQLQHVLSITQHPNVESPKDEQTSIDPAIQHVVGSSAFSPAEIEEAAAHHDRLSIEYAARAEDPNCNRDHYLRASEKQKQIAAELRAGPTPAPQVVWIKPLEWKPYRNGDADAVTPFAEIYTAYAGGAWRITTNGKAGKFVMAGDNIDAAKAGAQAHYARRIRAALATATEGGADGR